MSLSISIEVCIKDGQSTTEKGRILEQLTIDILLERNVIK